MLNRNLLNCFLICLWMGVLFVFCQNASAATDYSAKELKQLIGSGEPILLLNPLSEIEFNEAHIPGSVNIPVEMIMRTKKLPKKKDMLIVTYCKGPKWFLYKEAASLVANRLYSNVATFKGGLSAWKKAGYALNTSRAMPKYRVPTIEDDEFKQLLGTACYVDVRTPKLYGLGNIKAKFGPNADKLSMDYKKKYFLKIPLYQLSSQYNKIPRGRRIVVFDDKGKQALIASRFLIYSGYKDVCMLKGGISKVKGSEWYDSHIIQIKSDGQSNLLPLLVHEQKISKKPMAVDLRNWSMI